MNEGHQAFSKHSYRHIVWPRSPADGGNNNLGSTTHVSQWQPLSVTWPMSHGMMGDTILQSLDIYCTAVVQDLDYSM